MDRQTRLALVALVIAYAVWRFVRYMRLGLSRSRRPMNLGVSGGVVPQDADLPPNLVPPPSGPVARTSGFARIAGVLVAIGVWLAINAILWYCLLELPPLKNLPPILLGVTGIFANFYLIPLARKAGMRSRQHIEGARAGVGLG